MKAGPGREIVIEYERVQRIKKRSSTQLFHCEDCGEVSDFVSLTKASSLFDVEAERLNGFITANRCHLKHNICGNVFVCLASLLSRMQIQANIKRLEQ
jgi:hypothetical protein